MTCFEQTENNPSSVSMDVLHTFIIAVKMFICFRSVKLHEASKWMKNTTNKKTKIHEFYLTNTYNFDNSYILFTYVVHNYFLREKIQKIPFNSKHFYWLPSSKQLIISQNIFCYVCVTLYYCNIPDLSEKLRSVSFILGFVLLSVWHKWSADTDIRCVRPRHTTLVAGHPKHPKLKGSLMYCAVNSRFSFSFAISNA